MKREMMIVALLIVAVFNACANWAPIYGADIIPEHPIVNDGISIHVFGEIGSASWYIDRVLSGVAGNDVVLEVYFLDSGIGMPVIAPWEHTENIGL